MKEKALTLYQKHKMVSRYLFFGVLATLVNILSYLLFARVFGIDEVVSNILSWVAAALFAYLTNRLYVFESEKHGRREIIREMSGFMGMRLFSGVFDIATFALLVRVFLWNDIVAKFLVQIIVTILNYLFSKLVIFRKS
jgi:putative flippase GtrA